jgi:uncharacterized membrane protein YuzA (DUF378 family)
MLLGQALGNSVWWIVATVIVGLACMLMLIPFHRTPAKKKLPVRRASRQQIKRKA